MTRRLAAVVLCTSLAVLGMAGCGHNTTCRTVTHHGQRMCKATQRVVQPDGHVVFVPIWYHPGEPPPGLYHPPADEEHPVVPPVEVPVHDPIVVDPAR